MSKFSSKTAAPNVTAPVKTTGRALTYEGGLGFSRDPKSELFLLAVTNRVREQTFYEEARERDARYRKLLHRVVADDPGWVRGFIPYLRNTMQMRSASVVAAAEYLRATGPGSRAVVASALSRADEPAEILAYWSQEYGRNFPQPLKRGVADAVERLYNERSALKYDGVGRAWRMGDVIELTHPVPADDAQSDVFRYLLDRRRSRFGEYDLAIINRAHALDRTEPGDRRELLRSEGDTLRDSGFTWERLSGWLPGGMDAEAWEAIIPSMGYRARLRTLRNFEQAGVSAPVLAAVAARIADPEEVARSRQFPYRFLSAWKATASATFLGSLAAALDASTRNIPAFPGRTLVLTDSSGSMQSPVSDRSGMQRYEVGALFALALAKRGADVDLVNYASSWETLRFPKSGSLLPLLDRFSGRVGAVGHGTETYRALREAYDGHDRVVIVTDEQAFPDRMPDVPAPIYTFNVAGYAPAHLPSGEKGRYTFGGLTDAGFRLISILEETRNVGWPWEEGND